ncbi:MAG TPA: Vi polysaccharide biosynthesis UDP-N-acetylglucosamine C-6 dehydrogenase TviB, partial [Alphaproteobacteria bacterium]|nr:Vi polysaccharide biosynthesis UDP-N-acetylglucosamine C-6 dehydrogenase TviB [Alphaproteobacteria bacterium]
MKRIAVIGLGYVGLPLAAAFGEKREVVGFDINPKRIAELKDGIDFTREVSREELASSSKLSFTDSLDGIADCQVYIVTVPTPIDEYKSPDLTPLVKASESVGKV